MSKRTINDYIIVGQGLAGTVLTWFLQKAGKTVLVIDDKHQGAASTVAAGIINPITGRRFVKSWRFDEFSAFAQRTYRQMEYVFEESFFYKRNILRVLQNNKEENDWLARSYQQEYANYMEDYVRADLEPILQPFFSLAEITGSAQLDIPLLTTTFAKKLNKTGALLSEKFDFSQLQFLNDSVQYKTYSASKIIFCEGQQALFNPYFKYLPFVPAKGETLIVKITNYPSQKMLKNGIYIVPLTNKRYWVGASNTWNFEDDNPTPSVKKSLLEKLEAAIQVPFEVLEHKAAIRPTVKDRRPFLGLHPQHSRLAIFNGLGTKGASLAPFWAKHFCDFLVDNNELDAEVDIRRFET